MTDGVFGKNSSNRALRVQNTGKGKGNADFDSKGGFSHLILSMAKAALFGFVTASAILMILSCLAVFYDIPDMVLNYIIIAVSLVCLFIVGYKAAAYNSKNGLVTGILTGLSYTVLLYAAACVLWNSVHFSPEMIVDLLAGSAISGLGGFMGVNRRAKNKKKKRR